MLTGLLTVMLAGAAISAQAQPQTPAPAVVEKADRGEPDLPFVPSEPDFTLVSLPTTLRLPAGRWGFRVAHRFTRDLGQGSLGDLASDFFGFDSGAIVGLELRYGLWPGTQLSLLRTSDRTIQFLGQMSVLRQSASRPFGLDALAAVQGGDNFTEDFTGTFGANLSRRFAERGAVYVQPLFIVNPLPESATASDSAFMLGLGARVRVTSSMYVVGEFAPRLSGDDTGDHHASFAVESRRGGHSFQINFSNTWAMTLGQVARSYGSGGNWHIGFNITRKFY